MQPLHWLPRFLLRHKTIYFLCKIGLQNRVSVVEFNNGARTVIDLSDPEPRNVFIQRKFEPHFFDIAKALTPQDGVFFDLGANVGFCSFGLVPYRPRVSYHLFEASPMMIDLLERSIRLHPEQPMYLTHACLSEVDGTTLFHLEEKQSGQSRVALESEGGVAVGNLRLDQYCAKNSIEEVAFVKMDLEGHELPTLRGWKEFLEQKRAKAIYLEIIPENQSRYDFDSQAPLDFLESMGYTLFLCKAEDFGAFGQEPSEKRFANGPLVVSSFRAHEYPPHFATDVLAVAENG